MYQILKKQRTNIQYRKHANACLQCGLLFHTYVTTDMNITPINRSAFIYVYFRYQNSCKTSFINSRVAPLGLHLLHLLRILKAQQTLTKIITNTNSLGTRGVRIHSISWKEIESFFLIFAWLHNIVSLFDFFQSCKIKWKMTTW